jgi:photosystem II stability/assembly factor-like uncharacterized protein
MLLQSIKWSYGILVFVFVILAGYLPGRATTKNTNSPKIGWRSVDLPFRPMDVSAVADSLWVCGADEMIAVSHDGGNQWSVKHQNQDGDILLRIAFVNPTVGYAVGTNGTFLSSRDRGETWTAVPGSSETILDISFSDEKHGIRRGRSRVETTEDGGLHWTDVSELRSDPAIRPFTNILSIASLDANHSAIALHQTQGENIFVITLDSGKNWKSVHLDNTFAGNLFTHKGEYWAFGIEYVEREKRGGYSVPVAIHSADGEKWAHGVRAPAEFNSCVFQGCILYDGAIADLYNEKPVFLAVPADGSLQPSWALAKDTVCTVGVMLKCARSAVVSEVPQRPPAENRPHSAGVGIPQAYETPMSLVSRCLSCQLGSFPVRKDVKGMAVVEARFIIKKDGTVREARVKNAPLKEIESGTEAIVREWFFEPTRNASGPTEVKESIRLNVACFAFPDNDLGTCTVLGPPPPKRP